MGRRGGPTGKPSDYTQREFGLSIVAMREFVGIVEHARPKQAVNFLYMDIPTKREAPL